MSRGADVLTSEAVTKSTIGFPTITIAKTIAEAMKTETTVFAIRDEIIASQAFPDCSGSLA
jgi:hypothetical protein